MQYVLYFSILLHNFSIAVLGGACSSDCAGIASRRSELLGDSKGGRLYEHKGSSG
jgi:hypothetical protein